MASQNDFQAVQQNVTSSLVTTTKLVGQLVAEDLPYQIALDPSLSKTIDQQNARILALAQRLVDSAASGGSIKAPKLRDVEDVDTNWRGVVDIVDSMLEKADICMDEYTGMIKRGGEPPHAEPQKIKKKKNPWQLEAKYRTNVNMVRPQVYFDPKPDNWTTTPFRPLLESKPHAIISLSESLQEFINEQGFLEYKHPYESEVNQFKFPDSVYKRGDPHEFTPLDSSKAIFVDTVEALDQMLHELKNATEIAVDLEHHDELSFIGLTCLMQISTRNQDWIVDTLKPWRTRLQVLNEVFADPTIVKVFHGAYMDIIWLQRDLGIYVVGLFDTYHACRALGYPQASLGYLLEKFVGFDADKQFQMADWRIRPLPEEMLYYAQSDTHFLLYIYDKIRNELIERSKGASADSNRLEDVLEKSKETSLQRYQRFIYDKETGSGAGGWYPILARTPGTFDKHQFAAFRDLHQWRDNVAREVDESVHRIMPKQALIKVSKILPTDQAAMQTVIRSASHGAMSQATFDRISDLVALVQKAKEESVNDPEVGVYLASIQMGDQKSSNVARSLDVPAIQEQGVLKKIPSVLQEGLNQPRATFSKFWGSTFGSSLWSARETPVLDDNLRLALPMPPLTAEIFQSPITQISNQPSTDPIDPGARAEHAYVKDRKARKSEDDSIFIIKQMGGRKRKPKDSKTEQDIVMKGSSEDLNGLEADNGDQVMTTDGEPQKLSKEETRAARKKLRAERKASKKQNGKARETKNGLEPVDTNGDSPRTKDPTEEEPFDYAKAKSVLHAKGQASDGRKGKKEFNPYSKSTDAPKGMRRVKKEQPGKSATFKS